MPLCNRKRQYAQSLTYRSPKAILQGIQKWWCVKKAALCCCFVEQLLFTVGVGGCVPLIMYQRGGTGGVIMSNSLVVMETSEKKKLRSIRKKNWWPAVLIRLFYNPWFHFIFLNWANKEMQGVGSWAQMCPLQFQSSSLPKDEIVENLIWACSFITFPSRNATV